MADKGNDKAAVNGIDALIPQEIAIKAELIGARKARLDAVTLLALATLAGAFIGLGSMFATTVLAGTAGTIPFGLARLIAGAVFSLGWRPVSHSHSQTAPYFLRQHPFT